MNRRLGAFIAVGAAGFVLQIAVVAVATAAFGWSPAAATVLGVEAAVIHNYFWHEQWTWADRAVDGRRFRRLCHFHLTTGVTSVAGNLLIVLLAVHLLDLGPVVANALAVGALSLANYVVADRYVFKAAGALSIAAVTIGMVR